MAYIIARMDDTAEHDWIGAADATRGSFTITLNRGRAMLWTDKQEAEAFAAKAESETDCAYSVQPA